MVDLWLLFLYIAAPLIFYLFGAGSFPKFTLALGIGLLPAFISAGVPLWWPYGVLAFAMLVNDLQTVISTGTVLEFVLVEDEEKEASNENEGVL